MNKISAYFTTLELIQGFYLAVLGSAFIYLNHFGISLPWLNTILALSFLFLLLRQSPQVWFFTGAFIGLFWFWWIAVSLKQYQMLWAIPIELLIISMSYGFIFWLFAFLSEKMTLEFSFVFKALALLSLSFIHPFSFDWFKPELIFIESYLGIQKWQFGIILMAMVLTLSRKQLRFLPLILFAYQPHIIPPPPNTTLSLITTHTTVTDKWNESLYPLQFKALFDHIDNAIDANHSIVVLPESVFPLYLSREPTLIKKLQQRAKKITIVTGGLYWDGKTPRNSTYIFNENSITIANKVVLVPFGESNPLPDFLSDWVNQVFYDGAVDYQASTDVIDYEINGTTYRNSICFEATSEQLYTLDKKGNPPKNMIIISNNGWFIPSIEPTLQRLLLQYYSLKYGTILYHAINMSPSYTIQNGQVIYAKETK